MSNDETDECNLILIQVFIPSLLLQYLSPLGGEEVAWWTLIKKSKLQTPLGNSISICPCCTCKSRINVVVSRQCRENGRGL